MIASYHGFFRFPQLVFELTSWSVVAGTAVSFAAASLGVLTALQTIVHLNPAVAMQPAPHLRFRRSALPWLGGNPVRAMIIRNLLGRPWRALLTTLGIAFAVPMVVLGLFWRDAIDQMMEIQFTRIERGNTFVTFPQPLDRGIVRDLTHEKGVLVSEGQRIVPVRLRAGHRTYLTSIIGLPAGGELRQPIDAALRKIDVPPEGIVMTRRLADRLGLKPGDVLTVEVMEGRRHVHDLPLSATVEEVVGMAVYMDIGALNRLTGEGDVVSAAELYVEPSALGLLSSRFKDLPVIASVAMKAQTLASFLDKIAGIVFVAAGILTAFAVIIAIGVVYNSARISLHERAWELASLRVLGFTRAEVSRIIFAEFMIEIAVGIPLGLWFSQVIVDLIARFHSNESFQIPAVIGARTFAIAAVAVLAAAAASAYVVRRRIDHLDLVAVLKTRD
jgi:putative ABC transport system permease protein